MPSYYFHLAFELYQQPCETADITLHTDGLSACFLPPRNFDIFRFALPQHQPSSWASFLAPRRESRKQKSAVVSTHTINRTPSSSPERKRGGVRGIGLNVDDASKTSSSTVQPKEKACVASASRDWRFDKLTMESIDMELQKLNNATNDRDEELSATSTPSLARDTALRGKYVPSTPMTTEIGWGVVHLYRDATESPELGDGIRYSKQSSRAQPVDVSADLAYVDKQCTTLCILAVPSYMTPSDLLGWVGEETRNIVSHFRLVRTARSNRYMVLLKFKNPKAAKKWQKEWNGKLFNSTEPENCHIVFVRSIQFQAPDVNRDPSSFPDMSNDPFTPMIRTESAGTDNSSRIKTSLSAKPAPPPTPALIELPTCPVCLERMDETTGLATIFCQHVFHCACLQNWRGSGCPVCRYTQNDPMHRRGGESLEDSECKTCGSTSNLWICLICGHIGCGRYEGAHAFEHYEQTAHSYAMDIATQHVWDYVGDGYVHRLIQSAADGKLVELPSAMVLPYARDLHSRNDMSMSARSTSIANTAANSGAAASPDDNSTLATSSPPTDLRDTSPPTNKLEQLSLEYTTLLTSQLASQRTYFEQQLDRAVDKAAEASADAAAATSSLTDIITAYTTLQSTHETLINETLPALQTQASRAERRAEKAEEIAKRMEKAWREAESVSGGLMERIKHLEVIIGEEKRKVENEKAKVMDLEEQNRDLTFFISGQERLREAGEEVRDGLVTVAAAPVATSSGAKRKKKKGKAGGGGGSGVTAGEGST